MNDPLLREVSRCYESNPASVSAFRDLLRELIGRLSDYSELEKEIINWDKQGRSTDDFERLRKAAWNFSEADGIASRSRIFAGFVTNQYETDGYAAEFLFDFAVGSGLNPEIVHEIMIRHNS